MGLKAGEQCDVPGKLIVLPPLFFDFAGGESPASFFEERAVQSVPEGFEVWLHVVVEAGSLAGNESEQTITERVDAFVKSMPLSAAAVRGLLVEIKEPLRAPDLFAFGLVRLALAAKGNNAGLRVAFVFQPGFVGRHGDIVKRLAIYSDLLGTTYAEGWRQDAAWIAEQALNKPVILLAPLNWMPNVRDTLAVLDSDARCRRDLGGNRLGRATDAKAAAAVCAVTPS